MIKHFDNQDHCNYLMLTFMINSTVAALEISDSNYQAAGLYFPNWKGYITYVFRNDIQIGKARPQSC